MLAVGRCEADQTRVGKHMSQLQFVDWGGNKSKRVTGQSHVKYKKQKCAGNEHCAVKHMLLVTGIFCHVVGGHSVLCQHVLCLQGVLSDHRSPLPSLLAAGDLKPTRAVALVSLKSPSAAVYSLSGSRSALQEGTSHADRRAVQMMLNRTRAIQLEVSLPCLL